MVYDSETVRLIAGSHRGVSCLVSNGRSSRILEQQRLFLVLAGFLTKVLVPVHIASWFSSLLLNLRTEPPIDSFSAQNAQSWFLLFATKNLD